MDAIENGEKYKWRIDANNAYFRRILSILSTKCKVIPVSFNDKTGKEQESKLIQIADSQNNSVSLSKKKNVIKVALDGTNFVSQLAFSEDGTKYGYQNKLLGVEYYISEREMEDETLERIFSKKIGDIILRAKYYVRGDFVLITEFIQQGADEKSSVALVNTKAKKMNDIELLRYIDEQIEISMEDEFDEEESDIEDAEQNEVYDELDEIAIREAHNKELEINDTVSQESDEIVLFTDAINYKICAYDFPYNVDEFDNKDYEKFTKGLINKKVSSNKQDNEEEEIEDEIIEEQELEEDDYYYSSENDHYQVFYKEAIEDPILKNDTINMIYASISIENQEIIDIAESLNEVKDEFEKAERVIRKYYKNNKSKGTTQGQIEIEEK